MQGRSRSIPGMKAASTERGWREQQERQSREETGSKLAFFSAICDALNKI